MSGIFREKMRRIHISIPESLEDDMRDFIATTYHRYEKGGISSLVTEAIREHIDPGTHTQKRNSKKHTNHKYDLLMIQINSYLMPKYRYSEFNNVPEKHIDEAISAIMDIRDNRSIKGWRKKLEVGGYIERVSLGAKVFKVLKDIKDVSVTSETVTSVTSITKTETAKEPLE